MDDRYSEGGEGMVYEHRLRKGVNRQSYGLEVARLANVPEETLRVARVVLERLQEGRFESSALQPPSSSNTVSEQSSAAHL